MKRFVGLFLLAILVTPVFLFSPHDASAEHEYSYPSNYTNSGGGAIPPDFEEDEASATGEHDDEIMQYGESPHDSGLADDESADTQEITSLFEKIVNWIKSIFN